MIILENKNILLNVFKFYRRFRLQHDELVSQIPLYVLEIFETRFGFSKWHRSNFPEMYNKICFRIYTSITNYSPHVLCGGLGFLKFSN